MSGFQRLAGAMLLGFAVAASAAPEGPWVSRSVHGYRVSLAVESVANVAPTSRERRHESPAEHVVAIRVLDWETGRAAGLAQASIDVAEQGYAGVSVPLLKAADGSGELYRARVSLATGTTYRFLVELTPVGASRTLEAQFTYRHHH